MVLLSVMPCSDELENQVSINNTTSTIAHEKDDCNTESCTSICLCTCCGQSVIEVDLAFFAIKTPTIELPSLNTSYQFQLSQSDQNIWQPPKLG